MRPRSQLRRATRMRLGSNLQRATRIQVGSNVRRTTRMRAGSNVQRATRMRVGSYVRRALTARSRSAASSAAPHGAASVHEARLARAHRRSGIRRTRRGWCPHRQGPPVRRLLWALGQARPRRVLDEMPAPSRGAPRYRATRHTGTETARRTRAGNARPTLEVEAHTRTTCGARLRSNFFGVNDGN
jgi:hypothetical protein